MAFVLIDQTQPGMVLAANVLDQRGRLLIPHGKELSEKHIAALQMWGVESVEIQGDHIEEAGAVVDDEVMAEARTEIDELFRNAGEDHPLLVFLKKIATERHAVELATKQVEAA